MNTIEHPKARKAREKSAIRTFEKEKIKHAIAAHGVHFFALGRYTFCYRVDKRNVIEVSSAIRHPGDKNDPHVGRMQALAPGLQLREAWERIDRLDSELDATLDYAFSPRLGYLTACPTNVGTALRASVMMHLAGLALLDEMRPVINGIQKLGLTVRGLWGEGTEASGNLFQVSNQMTLGESEGDIIHRLHQIVVEIIGHERNARARLMGTKEHVLRDTVGRAWGILRHAHVLTSREALDSLSALRLGIDAGILDDLPLSIVDELLLLTQPAHLQSLEKRVLSPEERDVVRARLVRERLNPPPRRRGQPRKTEDGPDRPEEKNT